jgi:hypothetical protein
VRYGQDMTTEPTDPRPIMRRLWQMSGLDAPTVLARAGVTEDDDPSRYSRLRRVLSGILYGSAQEVGALLSALGLHPGSPIRGEYVRVYLRWANAHALGILARDHGVTERWATVLARLAEGPAAYGPHDVEALCDALQRVVAERDRLLRVLAVEQGDRSQFPPGWRTGTYFMWVRDQWAIQPRSNGETRWELIERHSSAGYYPTLLDAMEAADGGGQ